jgi:RNA polymerase sigma-70 factor (ECF subfamily)
VARHAIYDCYGERQTLPLETIEQWSALQAADPEKQVLQSLDAQELRSLIGVLSHDQQEVLLLRFDQQLSLQETADIMGKHINTVKTLQYRAVKHLQQMLKRSGGKAGL